MDALGGRAVAMDFGGAFLPAKRTHAELSDALESPERRRRLTFVVDEDREAKGSNEGDAVSRIARFASAVGTGGASWKLSAAHSIEDNQTYLNDQLEHAVALSSILESSQAENQRKERDAVRQLDVAALWKLIEGAGMPRDRVNAAEKHLRDVMDVVSYLLHMRNQGVDHQNRLGESLRVAEKEAARKQHVIEVLRGEVEAQKQAIAQQQNVFKAKEHALLSERKTLQTEKKALEVQCARLQGVETAYKAQLRRKDAEYERLRKNLQESVVRATKEKRGITTSKLLNGVGERRKLTTTSHSNESKLTKQIVANLEKKNAELLFENEALSTNYDTLQRQLESLTGQYKKAVQLFLAQKNKTGGSTELEKLAKAPIDDFTPTPFNMATKQSVPEFISQSMQRLNGKLEKFEGAVRDTQPAKPKANLNEVVDILQKKLDDAHAIIREQDHLLQASLLGPLSISHGLATSKSVTGRSRSSSSRSDAIAADVAAESTEDLENERRTLAIQRRNLERERQLLQEQAMKLDQDRLEFEVQKHDQMKEASGEVSESPTYTSLSNREIELCSTPPRPSRSWKGGAKDAKQAEHNSPLRLPVAEERRPLGLARWTVPITRDVCAKAQWDVHVRCVERAERVAAHLRGLPTHADPPGCRLVKVATVSEGTEGMSRHFRIGIAIDTAEKNQKHRIEMENQQEAVAVVFPSRTSDSDKQALQRIHDRNLVHIHDMWEHVRELEERCSQLDQKPSSADSGNNSNVDVKAAQEELQRETAQLKELVREHAISPAIDESANQHEHAAASDAEVQDQEQDQALAQVAVVPMTADECNQVATTAYEAIGSFMHSRSFETTGMEVLGWTDRRQVEGNDVRFMLIKTFRGLAPDEVLDRAWRVMTSPRGMRGMYSKSMRMLLKRVQVVDDDNVLIYRVISSPDGRALARSLFLASRFTVDDKRVLMYRSVDPERLLQVEEQGKAEGATSSDGAAPIETWMNIFSWNVFEARGANGEDCKFACGGIVPGNATTTAQEWLLEVLLLALRWEAKVIGAEKSIKH